jgi:hypothetical protein
MNHNFFIVHSFSTEICALQVIKSHQINPENITLIIDDRRYEPIMFPSCETWKLSHIRRMPSNQSKDYSGKWNWFRHLLIYLYWSIRLFKYKKFNLYTPNTNFPISIALQSSVFLNTIFSIEEGIGTYVLDAVSTKHGISDLPFPFSRIHSEGMIPFNSRKFGGIQWINWSMIPDEIYTKIHLTEFTSSTAKTLLILDPGFEFGYYDWDYFETAIDRLPRNLELCVKFHPSQSTQVIDYVHSRFAASVVVHPVDILPKDAYHLVLGVISSSLFYLALQNHNVNTLIDLDSRNDKHLLLMKAGVKTWSPPLEPFKSQSAGDNHVGPPI